MLSAFSINRQKIRKMETGFKINVEVTDKDPKHRKGKQRSVEEEVVFVKAHGSKATTAKQH